MRTVNSIGQLKKAVAEIARTLPCGSTEEIMLTNPVLIQEAPRMIMEKDLSMIDAREEKDAIIITLENRFGIECRERGMKHAHRH